MALLQFPTTVKFAEVRMRIENDGAGDAVSEINFRSAYGPTYRETWKLDLALAPMKAVDARALELVLEAADGRANNLRLPMLAGVATRPSAAVVAVNATTVHGADAIVLDIAAATLQAGTLISLGLITDEEFQLFEVLEDAAIGTGVSVKIAPRVRYAFTTAAAVAVGAACEGRFQLMGDDEGAPSYAVNGAAYLNLSLIEAP